MTSQPTTTIETVTPNRAREWLTQNTANRSVRSLVVERYARDMAAGDWIVNGQAIIFNGSQLVDGQHRLHACIKADRPFESVVVRGVSERSMVTIDTGLARGLADVLKFNEETNVSQLAAAITLGWKWDNDLIPTGMNTAPTRQEALEWLDRNPTIREMSRFVQRLGEAPLRMSRTAFANIGLRVNQQLGTEFEDFVASIYGGADLSVDDPVYHLRAAALRWASTPHFKASMTLQLAIAIKSWNAWVGRQSMRQLRWGRTEAFPTLVVQDI